MRKLILLLLTLTTSCRVGGVAQLAKFPEADEVLPLSITVVSWNAQKGRNPELFADLMRLIEQSQADIIFLQEARSDLIQTEQIGGYFANSWKYPWSGGPTIGVMTLSKIAPLKTRSLPTKYREFFVTAPKVSLITEHPLPNGERLLAVNVHLLTFERWGTVKLRAQLDELESIMAEHAGPIVLAGDFNTWSEKRLGLVRKLAEDLRLKEVTDFPSGRKSADLHSSCLNWVFGTDKNLPLDRAYYRGLTNHTAQVLPYESSDHNPIMVTLTLQH